MHVIIFSALKNLSLSLSVYIYIQLYIHILYHKLSIAPFNCIKKPMLKIQ